MVEQQPKVSEPARDIGGRMVALTVPVKAPRFPAAVANHPAFTRNFNARLVAVGMAATNGHRRLIK